MHAGSRPQIILFGDSITEYATESFGWVSVLYSHIKDVKFLAFPYLLQSMLPD